MKIRTIWKILFSWKLPLKLYNRSIDALHRYYATELRMAEKKRKGKRWDELVKDGTLKRMGIKIIKEK